MNGFGRLGRATAIVVFSLAVVSAFAQSEPSNDQYEVYSAFLRIQLLSKNGIDDLRVGDGGSAIATNIAAFKKPLTKQRLSEIMSRLEGLESDTLESLAECTSKPYRLSRKFTLPTEYVLVDAAGARGHTATLSSPVLGSIALGPKLSFTYPD